MCQHSTAFRLEASDLTMSRWPPPHWLGAHPQVVDWVVVLACVAIQIAATSIAGRPADWTATSQSFLRRLSCCGGVDIR